MAAVDIMGTLPLHPRTALRHCIVRLLEEAGFAGRVFGNPEQPWQSENFPAIGVYMTEETKPETDLSPDPESRELTLAVDILEVAHRADLPLDDRIEALELVVQQTLTFEAVNIAYKAAGGILEDFKLKAVTLGKADEAETTVACLSLDFQLFYRMTAEEGGRMDDFITGAVDWDLADGTGPDGRIDAADLITLPQKETM